VRLTPETESQLQELSAKAGRPTDELVEEAFKKILTDLLLIGLS
jgi:predicted DNA-binding protein